MSEESKLPEIVVDNNKMTDISDESMKKVQQYMEAGLPEIATVDDVKLAKLTELYLSGKTYDQIANITRTDKTIVMYLSYKLNWSETRKTYMIELQDHMKRRIMEAKLSSQDFLLQLAQVWEKKVGHKLTRYLATDNEEHIDQINLKEVDRYLKITELLQKSMSEPAKDKGPLIGLNVGEGATITRKGDNQLEITPKQKAIGDVLKHYADLRRDEEKNK